MTYIKNIKTTIQTFRVIDYKLKLNKWMWTPPCFDNFCTIGLEQSTSELCIMNPLKCSLHRHCFHYPGLHNPMNSPHHTIQYFPCIIMSYCSNTTTTASLKIVASMLNLFTPKGCHYVSAHHLLDLLLCAPTSFNFPYSPSTASTSILTFEA